jgi:hypothetical protein
LDRLGRPDRILGPGAGEFTSPAHSPESASGQIRPLSEQRTDEVLFIRVHDSANDGRACLAFHTLFENPLTPGAPPRESIEVRTLVFFPG